MADKTSKKLNLAKRAKKLTEGSFIFSIRFMCSVLIFFGTGLNFVFKVDMSIAIVCMTNQTALNLMNSEKINQSVFLMNITQHNSTRIKNEECPAAVSHSRKYDGPFVWPKSIQGLILSAFFYGYIVTQLPGGYLSFRFGGQLIMGISMFFGSIITLLVPVSAKWSYKALIACLFLKGITFGAFNPGFGAFWAYWAPMKERDRLISISISGSRFGNVFAMIVGGLLCLYGFDGGWPSIFYVFGIIGVCWSVLFLMLSSNSPKTHRFISENEREYILKETQKVIESRQYCRSKVPWIKILTSRPCWAIFVGHFCHSWGMYLFLTQIPTYLKEVLKFDMKSNGFISAIPYISSLISINISSIISDKLLQSGKLSQKTIKRIFIFLGMIVPSFIIIGLSFIDCQHIIVGVVLLALGVGFESLIAGPVFVPNVNSIAGPYSGIICGISNTIASISGLLSPYIANILTPRQTQKEWQIVFIICSVISFIGGVFYILFIEVEYQPWAVIENTQKKQSIENQ